MENNEIKLLSKNKNLLFYFNEIIFGTYDDGELHNFLITNPNFKDTFFVVSESNDESSISSFIKNNITSNNLLKNFTKLNDNVDETDIIFSPTNYSIVVLTIDRQENSKGIEINSLGIMEWLLSNVLFGNNIDTIQNATKLLSLDDYSLFALNYNDISKNFQQILTDENVDEIINFESII